MSGQMPNENARAHLLASLEYGVSPLLPRDLYRSDEDIADARTADEAYAEYVASGRKSRPFRELAEELEAAS